MMEFPVIKGQILLAYSTVDANKDGLSDAFGTGD
jgi:hypothetical protein